MKAQRTGTVQRVNDSRTAAVLVSRLVMHPKYGKQYRRSHTFLVDVNPTEPVAVGDQVAIEATRPISKRKHWRVLNVITRATGVVALTEEEISPSTGSPLRQGSEGQAGQPPLEVA